MVLEECPCGCGGMYGPGYAHSTRATAAPLAPSLFPAAAAVPSPAPARLPVAAASAAAGTIAQLPVPIPATRVLAPVAPPSPSPTPAFVSDAEESEEEDEGGREEVKKEEEEEEEAEREQEQEGEEETERVQEREGEEESEEVGRLEVEEEEEEEEQPWPINSNPLACCAHTDQRVATRHTARDIELMSCFKHSACDQCVRKRVTRGDHASYIAELLSMDDEPAPLRELRDDSGRACCPSCDPRKWRIVLEECRVMSNAIEARTKNRRLLKLSVKQGSSATRTAEMETARDLQLACERQVQCLLAERQALARLRAAATDAIATTWARLTGSEGHVSPCSICQQAGMSRAETERGLREEIVCYVGYFSGSSPAGLHYHRDPTSGLVSVHLLCLRCAVPLLVGDASAGSVGRETLDRVL